MLLSLISTIALAAPLLVLDPGHQPSLQGAKGQCGKLEFQYNDEAVAAIASHLEGIDLRLTREAGQELFRTDTDREELPVPPPPEDWARNWILWGRPALANRLHSAAFISVHHDSTPDRYLDQDPNGCEGKGSIRLNQAFRDSGYKAGYAIFIYDDSTANPERYQASLKLAKLIGAEFRVSLGRTYSTFHQNKDDCRECVLLDPENGVYYKNLAVTRLTKMPAVLVEIGTIADETDEKSVNTETFRKSLGEAFSRALKSYFGT